MIAPKFHIFDKEFRVLADARPAVDLPAGSEGSLSSSQPAKLLALLIVFIVSTGCISIPTHERGLESSYHAGRQSVIWQVEKWASEIHCDPNAALPSDSITSDDFLHLLRGMKDGEYIWTAYFLANSTKQKPSVPEWHMDPFTFKKQVATGERQ